MGDAGRVVRSGWTWFRRRPTWVQIVLGFMALSVVVGPFLDRKGTTQNEKASSNGAVVSTAPASTVADTPTRAATTTSRVAPSTTKPPSSTSTTQPSTVVPQSPPSTLAPETTPMSPLALVAHEVVAQKDVSAGSGATRLALDVEAHTYPVTADQLRAVATDVIKTFDVDKWQALSISIRFDRRETIPALAVFEWAPNGQWERASEGNPKTWAGYKLHELSIKGKVTNSSACSVPPEDAFAYAAAYKEYTAKQPDADDDAVFAAIAAQRGVAASIVRAGVQLEQAWEFC